MILKSGGYVLAFLTLLVLSAFVLHAFREDSFHSSTTSRAILSQHSAHDSPPSSSPADSSVPPLSDYRLVWSDEFDQPDGSFPLASNWNAELGCGLYNGELQCYTQSTANAYIQRGRLHIAARLHHTAVATNVTTDLATFNSTTNTTEHRAVTTQHVQHYNYTSARLTTQHRHSFTHPRLQASLRLPSFKGVWPALWLLGDSIDSVGWPRCGEIDVLETVNRDPTVHATLHFNQHGHASPNVSHSQLSAAYLPADTSDDGQFHLYELVHTAERMLFLYDGEVYYQLGLAGRDALDAFVARRFFLLLNVAVGGWWPGWDVDHTALPAEMVVDFVRVYEQK
ncbi:hypothetical protein MMC34_008252 [Xylographa carneopallida]|nr:hypothetical protein [Xylographa carneopallida]